MGPIDPNLLHFALVVVLGGIVLLAVTYLLDFFGQLLRQLKFARFALWQLELVLGFHGGLELMMLFRQFG